MVYESLYENARKPFRPDTSRGHWTSPGDFIYAGLSLGLRLDVISVSWVFFDQMGVYAIVPYVICLALYVVPLVVIHTFMGQFSSSGFISSLRISPIFKSMGYIAAAVNLSTLMYYSLLAALPLLFLFHSFRPTLPWSCEAFATWGHNLVDEPISHICNLTKIEHKPELHESGNDTSHHFIAYHVPSVLFFDSHFDDSFVLWDYTLANFSISWEMILCTLLTWGIIAGICYKFFNTEKLGIVMRYCVWVTMGLLVLIIIRVSFLHSSKKAYQNYFNPDFEIFVKGVSNIPIYVISAFGPGWGAMISLASFNNFKTNIMSHSWIICLGQMGIFLGFDLLRFLLEEHFEEMLPSYNENDNYEEYIQSIWVLFLSSGSILASMDWPNLWCILFFFMLTIAALVVIITHLFALMASLFDEFEILRGKKMKATFAVIGLLTFCSLYSCSNHGFLYTPALQMDAIYTQTGLNLLLLLVVFWIYGRERFQRDIELMLGRQFGTWRVNLLRYFSPLCLLGTTISVIYAAFLENYVHTAFITVVVVIFILLPWFFAPIHAVIMMLHTSGSVKIRFQRCCQPSYWFPVETEDRQRYDEAIGNMNIKQQMNEGDCAFAENL